MKQRDLLKLFNRNGWRLIREGGSHMIVTDGKEVEAIPRHKEINEQTAKAIIRRRGLKEASRCENCVSHYTDAQ